MNIYINAKSVKNPNENPTKAMPQIFVYVRVFLRLKKSFIVLNIKKLRFFKFVKTKFTN